MKNFVTSNIKIWLSVGCLLVAMFLVIGNDKSTANDYGEYLEELDMIDDTVPVMIPDDTEPTDDDFNYAFDDDDGTVIDIMVLYSPFVEAESTRRGSDIATEIAHAIDQANLINGRSRVEFKFNLVHAQAIDGIDTYDIPSDLSAVSNSVEVAELRNEYHADLVSYWTAFGDQCGQAFVPQVVKPESEKYGFSVVRYDCVGVPRYSFIHELGHNFGLAHDPATNGANPARSYGRGYALSGEFRTIMAQPTLCDRAACDRIPYWSNPDVSYLDMPTGTTDQDSARALNSVAQTVGNYRKAKESCHIRYEYVKYSGGLADTRVQIFNTGETDFNGVIIMWEQKEVIEIRTPSPTGLMANSGWKQWTDDLVGFATRNDDGIEREIIKAGEADWGVLRFVQSSPQPPDGTSFTVNGIRCSAEAYNFIESEPGGD